MGGTSWSGCYWNVSKALDVIRVVMSQSSCTGSVGVVLRLVVVIVFLQ